MLNFLKTLSLYVLLLYNIYYGNEVKLDNKSSFKELWNYCSRWIKGEL